jgi:hypothetical protein
MLRELYCAYNSIKDLFDVSLCPQLEVLDLEANLVSDVTYLQRLTKITDLTLALNPVALEDGYCGKIRMMCPSLLRLDE